MTIWPPTGAQKVLLVQKYIPWLEEYSTKLRRARRSMSMD
jgi:hypothetical protein